MPRKAEFYRALAELGRRAESGERQAEAMLDELDLLMRNVRNAIKAGDTATADELLADAIGRAYLRQALEVAS